MERTTSECVQGLWRNISSGAMRSALFCSTKWAKDIGGRRK